MMLICINADANLDHLVKVASASFFTIKFTNFFFVINIYVVGGALTNILSLLILLLIFASLGLYK